MNKLMLRVTHIYLWSSGCCSKRKASCDTHSATIAVFAAVCKVIIIVLCLILSQGCSAWLSAARTSLFNPNKIKIEVQETNKEETWDSEGVFHTPSNRKLTLI